MLFWFKAPVAASIEEPQTENLLDMTSAEGGSPAASPRDAWIETNEPVSLPDPVQSPEPQVCVYMTSTVYPCMPLIHNHK